MGFYLGNYECKSIALGLLDLSLPPDEKLSQ